jgi:hypothetical protein
VTMVSRKKGTRKVRTRADGKPSKADFVRGLPAGTSFADAAAKAKDVGIELSKAYYYVLKSEAKKAARSSSVRGGPRRSKRAAGVGRLRLASDDRDEDALLEAVRKLGTPRARALLEAFAKYEAP